MTVYVVITAKFQCRSPTKLYYVLQYKKLIKYDHKFSLQVVSNELMLVI